MICSTRTVLASLPPSSRAAPRAALPATSAVGTIDRGLERLAVGPAGVRGSRDGVDLGALGLERLVVEDRLRVLADLARSTAVRRQLERLDVDDLAGGFDDADLDVAELGGNDVAVDLLVAAAGRLRARRRRRRRGAGGARLWRRPGARGRCRNRRRRAVGHRERKVRIGGSVRCLEAEQEDEPENRRDDRRDRPAWRKRHGRGLRRGFGVAPNWISTQSVPRESARWERGADGGSP